MPKYDFVCEKCEHVYEDTISYEQLKSHNIPECPECGSHFTKQVWLTAPNSDKAKDPFDMLDGYRPPGKKVKSFANDRRKGGKDTT